MKFYREKKSFIGKSYYLNSLSSIVYLINNSILMPAGTTNFFSIFKYFYSPSVKSNKYFFKKNVVITSL